MVGLNVDRNRRALHSNPVSMLSSRPAITPFKVLATLLATLLLASCGGTSVSSGRVAKSRPAPPPARTTQPRTTLPRPNPIVRPPAQILTIPGLESVIGADALQLGRLFGTPRLDVIEDDARKLQWSGTACILDVYLYPQKGSPRATATYVDARRGDGRDVDRAACVAALRKTP